jgi:hypothetical protein
LDVLSGLNGKNSIIISDRLAEVQEQVDDMTRKLAEKTGETDEDGGGTIMNLKRAIKRIKEEVKEMHMTSAMVQQQVMSCRVEQASATRKKKMSSKKKQGGGAYSRRSRQRGNSDDGD